MENLNKTILDTIDGGIAPVELIIQSKIDKQRETDNSNSRVTIPAPAGYEMEIL